MLTMRNSADDVRMTYVPADNMQMTYMPADVMQTTYLPADNVWMTFPMTYVICQPKSPTKSHSHVIHTMCGWYVDDMHVMPGVVLHEIGQLRQGSHLEQLCIKPTGLLVNIYAMKINIFRKDRSNIFFFSLMKFYHFYKRCFTGMFARLKDSLL